MANRRAEGFEFWSMDPWTTDPWTRTMTSAFRFWLSFWPVAPFFGVEWRFAELAEKAGSAVGEETGRATERAVALGAAPVAAVAEAASEIVEATVVPEERVAEAPKPASQADDLTRIKGIGPGLARQLEALGIRSFAQLAGLSEKELAALDEKLTSIKGRCFRYDWVGQAKALAG